MNRYCLTLFACITLGGLASLSAQVDPCESFVERSFFGGLRQTFGGECGANARLGASVAHEVAALTRFTAARAIIQA